MSEPVSYQLQGQNGCVVLGTGNLTHDAGGNASRNVRSILAVTDCVIAALDTVNMENKATLVGVTVKAGTTVFGTFELLTLTSGTAVCYF